MAVADVGRVPIIERQSGQMVGLVARRDLLRVRTRVRVEEQHRSKMLHVRNGASGASARPPHHPQEGT
jgi:hypothetical protein